MIEAIPLDRLTTTAHGVARPEDVTVSADGRVGYAPELSVGDVESGKVDPYDSLYGDD